MAEEKKKLEIEDIKDPDDLDIEEVVAEDTDTQPESKVIEEAVPEEDDKDVLEKVVEESATAEKEEKVKPKKKLSKKLIKQILIGLLVAILVAGAVAGGVYYYKQQKKEEPVNTVQEEPILEEEEVKDEEPLVEEYLFINSEVGLNLREKPDAKAKVLAIIPFGYKIKVLEKQEDWVKTTYDNKTGWISAQFTQSTNPLSYENKTYGFGLTFNSSWAGYKFVEYKNPESTTAATYYVALPTTDKNWKEPNIPSGYASLFVMGVYTKAEWAKLAEGEMLPAKLGESAKYVYTYLPGQAYASDLKLQYGEISSIIKSFEVLK